MHINGVYCICNAYKLKHWSENRKQIPMHSNAWLNRWFCAHVNRFSFFLVIFFIAYIFDLFFFSQKFAFSTLMFFFYRIFVIMTFSTALVEKKSCDMNIGWRRYFSKELWCENNIFHMKNCGEKILCENYAQVLLNELWWNRFLINAIDLINFKCSAVLFSQNYYSREFKFLAKEKFKVFKHFSLDFVAQQRMKKKFTKSICCYEQLLWILWHRHRKKGLSSVINFSQLLFRLNVVFVWWTFH